MKKTGDILRIGILSLIISIGGSYALAEWTAPTSAPPGGNTPPSVNVGATTQVKNGNFGLGTGYTFWATKATLGTLQLGSKWSISANGDIYANDSWIRLMNSAGTALYGGFAANDLWANNTMSAAQYCFSGTNCISSWPPGPAGPAGPQGPAGPAGAAGAAPAGAVVAFASASCPAGWSAATWANGRQIIGTSASYALWATGGEASHTLSVNEIPSHSHQYNISINQGGWAGLPPTANNKAANENSNRTTYATGGGAAHNVMDPYIALKYCIKN